MNVNTSTDPDSNPQDANNPPAIDPKIVEEKASEIARTQVEGLKEQLIESLGGKGESSRFGKTGPKNWDELVDTAKSEAVSTAVAEAEKRILEKLEAERKAQQEAQRTEEEKAIEAKKLEWQQYNNEWREAVEDGLLPDIAPSVKEKIKEGKAFADLTPEEQKDPGLMAYNEVMASHMKLKSEGKSSSLYRTAQKFYNKPAGANAPVFGSSSPSTTQTDDYDYDEVVANRKQKFGY